MKCRKIAIFVKISRNFTQKYDRSFDCYNTSSNGGSPGLQILRDRERAGHGLRLGGPRNPGFLVQGVMVFFTYTLTHWHNFPED